MANRDTFKNIGVPLITFILGIIVQLFIQWLIPLKVVIPFGLSVIAVILVVLAINYSYMIDSNIKKFKIIEDHLTDIIKHLGLRGELIRDGKEGKSYVRSTELVNNAKSSIMIVSNWEPLAHPHLNDKKTANLRKARAAYFEAVKVQIERHKNDDVNGRPFHCRIVQLSKEYEGKPLTHELDTIFFEHLKYLVEVQQSSHPASIIRRATIRINMTFIIIDKRFIIQPITAVDEDGNQFRFGANIFEDNQGDFVKTLEEIYHMIEAHARPLLIEEFQPV